MTLKEKRVPGDGLAQASNGSTAKEVIQRAAGGISKSRRIDALNGTRQRVTWQDADNVKSIVVFVAQDAAGTAELSAVVVATIDAETTAIADTILAETGGDNDTDQIFLGLGWNPPITGKNIQAFDAKRLVGSEALTLLVFASEEE